MNSPVTDNEKSPLNIIGWVLITEIPEWKKYQDGPTIPIGVELFFVGTDL